MIITPTGKYSKKKDKINMNLDLMTYDTFCRYVLQPNSMVRMEHLVNLRRLMFLIDPQTYENDPEKVKRVQFIIRALEARLDENINDRTIIIQYVNGGLTYKVEFLDYDHLDLSKNEIQFIHRLVSETIQYQFMYNVVDQVQDIATRFKTSDYATRGNIVQEFKDLITQIKNDFRRSEVNDNTIDMMFSLRDGIFENCIRDTWNLITSPSRRLITGMQGLNELTGGGFESGRVYMFLGIAGVGKSLTLLNLLYQIKKYNVRYKTKDPTKQPCIVMLTMENTVVETITRLFDLVIENSQGLGNYTVDNAIELLRTQGQLMLNDGSPIDIIIKYKANRSVDTSYLYSLCDDLDDLGYEPVCLMQDHIKRIRSQDYMQDLRIELGEIVNEFKVFAAERDIPVITISHLNRDAVRILEDAEKKGGNQDAGKLLGKANTGESLLMIDNLDCGMTLTKDYDKEGNCYMCFNRVKMRDKGSTRSYIAQPFIPGSFIRLVEDLGGIPQFKETIHVPAELKSSINSIVKLSGANSMIGSLDELVDMDEDADDNAFSKKSYSLDPDHDYSAKTLIKPIIFTKNMSNDLQDNLADLKKLLNLGHQNSINPIKFVSKEEYKLDMKKTWS